MSVWTVAELRTREHASINMRPGSFGTKAPIGESVLGSRRKIKKTAVPIRGLGFLPAALAGLIDRCAGTAITAWMDPSLEVNDPVGVEAPSAVK